MNWRNRKPAGEPAAFGELERLESTKGQRLRGGAFDLVAVIAALLLVGIGLANLWVVGEPDLAVRQAVFAVAGLLLVAALWRSRIRLLSVLSWACYGASLVFLVAVLLAGSSANGATRWIDVGPVTFQPSELAKLGLLLVLAHVLGSPRPWWQRFTLAVLIAAVPVVLTLTQPDLSTCTLLVTLSVAMLILGRVPARYLLPLLAAAALAAPLVIGLLRPYQMERLGSFVVGAHQSASGAGWAVTQARIAVGSSALIGQGMPLTNLLAQYLPERHTDLALASVVEQFGLIPGAIVVLAALTLVWRLALASWAPRAPPGSLLAGGLAVLVGVETAVSLGGNLGLLPLAGVPFPLLSYGGSALVVHLAALGMVLGVRRDGVRRRLWIRTPWRARRPRWVRFAAVAISVLLVSFGLYGWRLHAVDGPRLARAGVDQMTRCFRLPAPRGQITDRHGTPLAFSPTDGPEEVLAIPALLRKDPAGITRLANLIGQPTEAVTTTLDQVPPQTLATKIAEVPAPVAASINKAGISGVTVIPSARRSYPSGPLLGSLLGFVGVATPAEQQRWPQLPLGEIVGRAGLEQQYDAVLRGVDGQRCVYVDPLGRPVAMGPRTAPIPGANLRLALDLGLQRVLADSLVTAMRGAGPHRFGAAVAIDPRNGQVLALVSVPSYDNNIYGPPVDPAGLAQLAHTPGSPMVQHAAQSAVPPGSTFKLVVATANQLHPVLNPNTVVPTGGSFTYGDHTFNNWRVMGPMNLPEAIAWSNDVYFYKLAVALGPQAMINAAQLLGVGQPTGIDLPEESPGYLGTPESVQRNGGTWYPGSTVILGIGQGYLTTTPLQVAKWTGAVTSGRTVVPRLGLATGTGGTWTAVPAPPPTQLPFAGLFGPIQAGMRAGVLGGTSTRLRDLPAPVGAKSGTAQDGSLPADEYDNWMTAAAPVNDPSIVVTALAQGTGLGGNSPAQVVRDGLAYYLAHQPEVTATGPVQSP